MSKGILKVKKYKKNEVKSFEATIRGAGSECLYYEYGADLVNYDGDSYFIDTIENRIKSLNLSRSVRKDAVYMVEVLITADRDFFNNLTEDKVRRFFHECFISLSALFGGERVGTRPKYIYENIISGVVDFRDNPCMHFCFVPVTGEGNLSAKDIVQKKMLFSLWESLKETVWDKWGLSDAGEESLIPKIKFEQIKNENTVLTEENRCLLVELEDLRELKKIDELDQIRNENMQIRSENIDLMFALDDLRIENEELQKKIEKLEMKKSQDDLGHNQSEMKNVLPIDGKSWTAVLMHELTLLRLSYDFLLRTYVGGEEDVEALPESKGKNCLKRLLKFYKDKEFKG